MTLRESKTAFGLGAAFLLAAAGVTWWMHGGKKPEDIVPQQPKPIVQTQQAETQTVPGQARTATEKKAKKERKRNVGKRNGKNAAASLSDPDEGPAAKVYELLIEAIDELDKEKDNLITLDSAKNVAGGEEGLRQMGYYEWYKSLREQSLPTIAEAYKGYAKESAVSHMPTCAVSEINTRKRIIEEGGGYEAFGYTEESFLSECDDILGQGVNTCRLQAEQCEVNGDVEGKLYAQVDEEFLLSQIPSRSDEWQTLRDTVAETYAAAVDRKLQQAQEAEMAGDPVECRKCKEAAFQLAMRASGSGYFSDMLEQTAKTLKKELTRVKAEPQGDMPRP